MLYKHYLLIVLLLAGGRTIGQGTKEVLNNQAVIEMNKAGLSKELIISKIENSDCKFNTTTAALIDLKKQKVPEEVITAMLNKPAGNGKPAAPVAASKAAAVKPPAVDLEILNLVHIWNKKTNEAHPLEKTSARMRTRAKALGYGGANVVFEVDGEKSAVRIVSDSLPVFIVNTGGPPPDGFVLYKLTVKKKYRQAVSANLSTIGGMKGSEGVVPVNIKSLNNGLFELSPATALQKGEYFFALKSSNNAMTTSNAEVYTFGVE